ncbi:MAG: ABC transporter permease subunit [Armatimonadetes bacterium]|nr:ABC transporter permease subunit [Armatimonadota bacterium]
MNFACYRALARSVILESLRRKDLWVVAILGFLIILAAGTLGFFGFDGLEIFAKDLAVTVLGLFSTIIAVLTSCRLIPDEVKNRTLYPLLSRPISRFDLLVGKLIGAVIVTWISFFILCLLTSVALSIFHVQFTAIMLQYVFAKMLGLMVVCAFSMALSVYLTPSAAATMAFILAFGSPMLTRGLTMSAGTVSPATKSLYAVITSVMPQVQLFDLGGRTVYPNWTTVPMWVLAFLLGYGLFYSFAMLGIGWLKFRKQAV